MSRVSTDSRRPRRRRVLLTVGLVPSILLLLLSARIVLLLHHQGQALRAYEAGDFEVAGEHFAANQVLNPIERWIAPFGEGDALHRQGELERAVAAFERSLSGVPEEHECIVRVNLALTHEAVGDAALEAGDRLEAQEAWLAGLTALDDCVERARDDAADQWLDTVVRVDRRLARKVGGNIPPPATDREQAPPEDDVTREKKRQLQQRNRQALEDRVRHQDEFDADAPPLPPEDEQQVPQW